MVYAEQIHIECGFTPNNGRQNKVKWFASNPFASKPFVSSGWLADLLLPVADLHKAAEEWGYVTREDTGSTSNKYKNKRIKNVQITVPIGAIYITKLIAGFFSFRRSALFE
tara:strand:- start:2004 stop:2336 length:333 start_codon:yes stop_codon:yes gene_type:complete